MQLLDNPKGVARLDFFKERGERSPPSLMEKIAIFVAPSKSYKR